jgi:hypothetical protein
MEDVSTMNKVPISVRRLKRSLEFHHWHTGAKSKISFPLFYSVNIRSISQKARPADLDEKYHIYQYRYIFVYLWDNMENGKKDPAAISK